jgi:hypothetical protein
LVSGVLGSSTKGGVPVEVERQPLVEVAVDVELVQRDDAVVRRVDAGGAGAEPQVAVAAVDETVWLTRISTASWTPLTS